MMRHRSVGMEHEAPSQARQLPGTTFRSASACWRMPFQISITASKDSTRPKTGRYKRSLTSLSLSPLDSDSLPVSLASQSIQVAVWNHLSGLRSLHSTLFANCILFVAFTPPSLANHDACAPPVALPLHLFGALSSNIFSLLEAF